MTPILFGADYSVYTRIARMALIEKQVEHQFEAVDVFNPAGPSGEYLKRQPFGKIPALSHSDFTLFETAAIARYVDEAFEGPLLQPRNAKGRARVAQIVGMLDAYAYQAMVWEIFVERMRKPSRGETPDEEKIRAAVERADLCLRTLSEFIGDALWLVGDSRNPSLADLHAAPMVACLRAAPEGEKLLSQHARLAAWWDRIRRRASMRATPSPMFRDAA
ncbi:MAG: glutathione S-transferase family protein [Beijerinckiaceae bacterium]